MGDIVSKLQENMEASFRRIVDFGDAKPSPKGEVAVCCPVHDDTKGSLRINVHTGKWNCFGCSEKRSGGETVVALFCFIHKVDWPDACQELEAMFGFRETPDYNVRDRHNALISNQKAMKSLYDRGLNDQVVKHFGLGLMRDRVCLPEYDLGGTLRQVIMHDTMKIADSDFKSLSLQKGNGVRLWPMQNLRKKAIYLFEGWLDALLAIQHGINAVSLTGSGANTWNNKFNKYFNNKEVYICYDADDPGKKASAKLANKLSSVATSVHIINLEGDKLPEKADFTDYMKHYTIADFDTLPKDKWVYKGEGEEILQDIPLSETTKAENYNKKIQTTAVVTGTSTLFQLPKTVEAQCVPGSDPDLCAGCVMRQFNGRLVQGINSIDKDLLNFIRVTDKTIEQMIKTKKIGIPSKCGMVNIEVTQVQNLEELVIVSSIDFNEHSSGYEKRAAYAVTDNKFEAGRPYIMKAVNVPDPKTQASSLLVYDANPTNDNIDSFQMSPQLKKEMSVFQAVGLEAMTAKRLKKYQDYEKVTQINGRFPMFFGMELVFFSGLSFHFRKRHIKRGYVNALFYGDTRTGKSEGAEKLMEHFRAGDTTSGENLSFAGLIGGLHQINGKHWTIEWGLMPLNDRRLLKIDEFHGMREGEFNRTSETISSGVATIHKIGKERAMARCRLMILSNTKENEHLSDYNYPCEAIMSVMGGAPEDVARLDFAMGIAKEDVPLDEVNKAVSDEPLTFTSDLCHNLVMWAWSRKAEDIVFTEDAEKAVMEYSDELLKNYHSKIPLIIQGEQTVKLARLSVACAMSFFSTDVTGEKCIVQRDHVKMVMNYLNFIYSARSSKYAQLSAYLNSKEKIRFEDHLKAINWTNYAKTQLLQQNYIRGKDIQRWFVARDQADANAILATLCQCNCLENYANNQYKKTPAFSRWLNERDFEDVNYQAIYSSINF